MRSERLKDKIWVQWNGRLYALPLNLNSSTRVVDDQGQELIAPFSCKVLKVHAKPGQEIKKGDAIIVVEAMKMEYSYCSPRNGTIESILVKEGEIVGGGTQFVRWRDK